MGSMKRFGLVAVLVGVGLGFISREAEAQRMIAPSATPGPFAPAIVEQGPAGDIQLLSLRGFTYGLTVREHSDDIVIYNRATGQAWHVYNQGILYGSWSYGPYAPLPQFECVVAFQMAPGLKLVASRVDDDRADDIVGVNAAGQIFRYIRRGAPAC